MLRVRPVLSCLALFFKIICMYLCALMYMWVQVPLATRGCRFPGAGLLELNSGPPKSSKHLTTEPSLQLCHLVSWKHFIYPVIFAWLLRLWDIAVRICKFCYSKHYWQSCCLLFVDLSKKKPNWVAFKVFAQMGIVSHFALRIELFFGLPENDGYKPFCSRAGSLWKYRGLQYS